VEVEDAAAAVPEVVLPGVAALRLGVVPSEAEVWPSEAAELRCVVAGLPSGGARLQSEVVVYGAAAAGFIRAAAHTTFMLKACVTKQDSGWRTFFKMWQPVSTAPFVRDRS